jgi:3-oxoacyl-[acyl-carrier-protein] synthase III
MTSHVPLRAIATASSTMSYNVADLASDVGLSDTERTTLADGGLFNVQVAQVDLVALVAEVIDALDVAQCRDVVFTHSLELEDAVVERLIKSLVAALPSLRRAPLLLTGRPCSVIHLGLEVAMRRYRRGDGEVLVLGGDVAPKHEDRFFFNSVMGDAAIGLLLGAPPEFGELLATHSTWHVLAADGVASAPADIARFRAQNPTAIRATIAGALDAADVGWADLAAIVPHTPYRQIWDTVAELCRYPRDRVLDQNIAATGHLNSNDVVVHLNAAVRDGLLRPGDVAALVSPGFGGTRGCTLIRVA